MGIRNLVMNEKSSLKQEWIVVDEPRMLLRFTDVCGVSTKWGFASSGSQHADYLYETKFTVEASETAVAAYEVRFLTFNIWGNHVRTLSGTYIADLGQYLEDSKEAAWRIYSESEAWEHYASIGYVARVRTVAGAVLTADSETVLREAQRLSEKFTEDDLEPKAPRRE
jgi:hypothetical protein